MLKTWQKQGDFPIYKKDYPHHGKWRYNGCLLHYYYYFNKVQPSKAILFYFSGLNDHGNSSAYFTMSLAEKCHIDIFTFDYQNFGRSEGEERGYISSS